MEHQFKSDTNMTVDILRDEHPGIVAAVEGKLIQEELHVVTSSEVSEPHTCRNVSLTNLFTPDYKVTGANVLHYIGEVVTVTCALSHQLIDTDKWDSNATDNTLTIMCKPNRQFDVPPLGELPRCLAQCPAAKPEPPAKNELILDTGVTSATDKIWQGKFI